MCKLIFITGFPFALWASVIYGSDNPISYESFPQLSGPYFGQAPPGPAPQVFCPEFLKPPEGFHSSVTFSPDMNEAYWTSQGVCTYRSRLEDGVWTAPDEIRFDSAYGVGEVAWAMDGNKLFFLSKRPPDWANVSREYIWYREKLNGVWSAPKAVDRAVNEHPTHWLFSIAENGNLYFTSEIEGVRGQQDIYFAQWDGRQFAEPLDLGPNINSDFRDFTPFIAPNESYLIFARSVPQESNRSDLFISFRDAEGNWLKAVNMGDTVNSLHNEVCPVVTPDGEYLFYCRISKEINEVLWVSADVIDSLRATR